MITFSSLTSVFILFLSLGGVRLSLTTFHATSIPSFVSYARHLLMSEGSGKCNNSMVPSDLRIENVG